MVHELSVKLSRFLLMLILCSATTAHVILAAVPAANRPGLVVASIASALIVAMYDIGVFRVDLDELGF